MFQLFSTNELSKSKSEYVKRYATKEAADAAAGGAKSASEEEDDDDEMSEVGSLSEEEQMEK